MIQQPDVALSVICRKLDDDVDSTQSEIGGSVAAISIVHAIEATAGLPTVNDSNLGSNANDAYEALIEAYDVIGGHAFPAFDSDTKLSPKALMATPLWHNPGVPEWLTSPVMPYDRFTGSGPEWSF